MVAPAIATTGQPFSLPGTLALSGAVVIAALLLLLSAGRLVGPAQGAGPR